VALRKTMAPPMYTVAPPRRTRLNLQGVAELAALADYSFAFAVRAVSKLGVADHLAGGPLPVGRLAELTACHERALLRTLRALARKGVFTEEAEGIFALAPMGELLRSDHPLSMRGFFRLQPDVSALAALEHSIRTGRSAFEHIYGEDYFTWLADHGELNEEFVASQRALNRLELLTALRCYPWAEVGSVVDVGGNDGAFLAALLARHEGLTGTLLDLPATVDGVADSLPAGIRDRLEVIAGDVLRGGVPPGAGAYTLKRVLVGFGDAEAVTVLRSVRSAMAHASRLLIMEPMQGNGDQVGGSLDLLMLVLGTGRVRRSSEFEDLLREAGLEPLRRIAAGLLTVVEARADEPG
jgi:O-methyltransferase domain